MTLEEIKRLRGLLAEATKDTPLPWVHSDDFTCLWSGERRSLVAYVTDGTIGESPSNAGPFIAAFSIAAPALLDLAEEGLRARERRDFLAASMAEHEAEIRHAIATESHEGMRTFAEFKADVRSRDQTPPSHGEVEAGKADLFGAFADTVKERDGDGFWRACSGCHETNEGCSTGSYPTSTVLGCEIGSGCSECGGIGVVWTQMNERDFAAWARASLSEPSGNAGAVGLEAPALFTDASKKSPDADGWLPHTPGDPQPVADDVIVDLKRADGEVVTGDAAWTAECWNWGANVWPSQHAIIAYRIVKGETDAE